METDHLKKVLLIDNSQQITGAFRSIRSFIKKLNHRINFYYAVQEGCWTSIEDIPANRLVKFNFLEIRKNLSSIGYLPQLIINTLRASALIRSNSIDVVHVNDLYNMVGVCLKFLHPNIKLIYHVRLRRSSYAQNLYSFWVWALKHCADVIICVSNTVEKDAGFSTEKVIIIYDGILESWYNHAISPDHENLHLLFLYVANYIPGKGQDHALRAFDIARREIGNIKLKFIGNTGSIPKNLTYFNKLKQFAQNNGLEEVVEFGDFSPNVSDEMASSDVVLNFSESESFSMVCLEALACKKAIIATRSGGPEEIIRDKINGVLLENRDVLAMGKAIVKLASSPKLRKSFSENAHIDFKTKFNINILAENLLRIYSS